MQMDSLLRVLDHRCGSDFMLLHIWQPFHPGSSSSLATAATTSCKLFSMAMADIAGSEHLPGVVPGSQRIAIVAMACRLPGMEISNMAAVLQANTDCITVVPADRWDVKDYPDMPSMGGWLAESPFHIDPIFSQLKPAAQKVTDPQQNLALEASWEVYSAAGFGAEKLTDVAVAAGVMNLDSNLMLLGSVH